VLQGIDLSVRNRNGLSSAVHRVREIDPHPVHQPVGRSSAGRIVVDGIELTSNIKNIEKVRTEVAWSFSIQPLSPPLDCENLSLGPIWVRKVPKKEAEEAAMYYWKRYTSSNRLENTRDSFQGGSSSGGHCRSLCMNPKVMLFDEPTSALIRK